MSENLEIEFKNMLTESEFELLCHYFNVRTDDFHIQENIYFDTDKTALKKVNAALRVRIKNNTYELTLKEPATVGLLETNQIIEVSQLNDIIDNGRLPMGPVKIRVESLLKNDIDSLTELARLKTKRVEFPYQNQQLFFDQSTYYDTTDYELELETVDYTEGKRIFKALLEQFSIPERNASNKIKRAYARQIALNSK